MHIVVWCSLCLCTVVQGTSRLGAILETPEQLHLTGWTYFLQLTCLLSKLTSTRIVQYTFNIYIYINIKLYALKKKDSVWLHSVPCATFSQTSSHAQGRFQLRSIPPPSGQIFAQEPQVETCWNMAVCQNLVPLVNIKVAGIYGCSSH